MRYLLTILMSVMCLAATADKIDRYDLVAFDKLDETQKAEVLAVIAAFDEQNKAAMPNIPEVTTPEQMQEWIDVGTAIGKGIAATAKELGIALDEFSHSRIGNITLVLIVYKVIGRDLVGYAFGTVWGITWFLVCIYMFKRIILKMSVETTEVDGKKVTTRAYQEPEAGPMWMVMIIAVVIWIVPTFVSIFG